MGRSVAQSKTSGVPEWLTSIHSVLHANGLPVQSIVATDQAVDIIVVGADRQRIVIELRPKQEPGPHFAVVGRHQIRYRAPKELGPANRALLARLLNAAARLEPIVPDGWRGTASVGEAVEDPAQALRLRFPFAFIERSASGGRVETELLVRMTPLCNQSCPFCSAPPHSQPSAEAFEACLDFICANFAGCRLTLTGGEPTLRACFFDEVRSALGRREIGSIQVQTNAVAFAAERRAAELPAGERLGFFVSLHAVDETIYDLCTATTGQLPLALDGIRNLLAAGHRVVLNAVATSVNYRHLEDLVRSLPRLFAGLPPPGLHFSVLICPDGRPGAADYLVRYSELGPALEAAVARAVELGIPTEPLVGSTHASLPPCLVAEGHRRTSAHRPRPGLEETGYEDFRRPWVKAESCRACALTDHCLGLPAPYALRFGFGELAPLTLAGPSRPAGPPGDNGRGSEREPGPSTEASARRRRRPLLPVPEAIVRKRPASPEVLCTRPWTTLEVANPDGLTRQCCADWTQGARGNVRHDSFERIWNGSGYQEARRRMSAAAVEGLCLPICPRLHDGACAERQFVITGGSERFVRNQVLLAEEIAQRNEVIRAMPLSLSICPSTYCNADCVMCLHGKEPRRDLPEEFWDELPRLLPTLHTLTLLGGEPLANPRVWTFLRDLDVERYPDVSLDLITNGGLLSETALDQVRRAAIGGVTISLNAGTAEAYERVQRVLQFDQILANLDALIRFRDVHPRWFGITLSFVVQPLNAQTLVEFGEIAHRRDLHIRLLPLSVPPGLAELDFYGSPDTVAQVVAQLDRFLAWTDERRPEWRAEIEATRRAILANAADRVGRFAAPVSARRQAAG